MSKYNEIRRIRRLPLHVALLAALPLGGLSVTVFAADVSGETRCEADTADKECDDNVRVISGIRTQAMSSAPIGINGGQFSGGAGVSIAIAGESATAVTDGDAAIGNGAYASGDAGAGNYAYALGANSRADGSGTTALGTNARATAANAVALGANSVADVAGTVSVGDASTGLRRQVVNVAAGSQATDAVNVTQLSAAVGAIGGSIDGTTGAVTLPSFDVQGSNYSTVSGAFTALDSAVGTTNTNVTNLQKQINDGTIGLVQQAAAGDPITVAAGKDGTEVNFTGTAGARKLTGVSAGALGEASTEAVNGAQLFATNANVQANTDNITTIKTQLGDLQSGAAGLVQQDTATGNITVAASTGGSAVDFTGTDGARKVTGVSDGSVAAGSSDAVNGSQLNDTNQQVSALDGRVSTAEGDITNIKNTLVDLGSGLASGITYDDPSTKAQVTLGGAAGTVVSNVAAGAIAAGSRDAINGGQLSQIKDQLQGELGKVSDRMDAISDGLGNVGNFDGDMENQRITNLAPGIEDTDAANLGQVKQATSQAVETAKAYTDTKFNALNDELQSFKGDVDDRFNRQDARIDRIGAMSAANTQMAINAAGVTGGRGRVAVGVGLQSDKSALSVGYANTLSDRVRFSFGGAVSGSEASVGVGAGFDL